MSIKKKLAQRVKRRVLRVRKKLKAGGLPRVSVFRSLNNIYAQVINDEQQSTLVSSSTLELNKVKGNKKELAKAVGLELAKKALKLGIDQAVFDRGPYLYHGRVKSLVDGLREGGLKI